MPTVANTLPSRLNEMILRFALIDDGRVLECRLVCHVEGARVPVKREPGPADVAVLQAMTESGR